MDTICEAEYTVDENYTITVADEQPVIKSITIRTETAESEES